MKQKITDCFDYGIGMKICELCHVRYDTGPASCNYHKGLLCDDCYFKGLRPITYPKHWTWVWFDRDGERHEHVDWEAVNAWWDRFYKERGYPLPQ